MTEDGKRKTAELIRKIAKTHTVLLVEHDMHIVRQIGQRITVLHQGQTLAEGPMSRGDEQRDGAPGLSGKGQVPVTLQVKAIDTFYGTSHILHGVSLDMADRELCAVLGRNGAGKTTLLRSITGVNPPTVGSIQLDGTEIAHLKSHRRAWLGISYVPQGREIIPDITVAENIYVALLGKGRKGEEGAELRVRLLPGA